MKILYQDNHLLVVFKPQNVEVQDLKVEIKQELDKKSIKSSFLESLFPMCREAEGIMVFALSTKAKNRLQEQIENQDFVLKSFAICVGEPKFQNKILYDDFTGETFQDQTGEFVCRNKKTKQLEHIPSLTENATNICDAYKVLESKDKICLVQIEGGFKFEDETRFVMFDAQSPVFGDKLYGGDTLAKNTNLALCVVETKFCHPTTNKNLTFRVFPQTEKKPWLYFNVEKFLKV